jgi:hypothetical protein
MSATLAPFGLRPAYHPSGLDRAQALAGGIASGYSSNIYKGQPVAYGTGGTSNGTIVPAAYNGAWAGAFAGVQWTDTTGRARVSNYWPANTAYTAGTCTAYFYNDNNIVYEIQADGSMAQTSIGNEYYFTQANVTNGSSTTGLSACTLASASAQGSSGTTSMRVVDLAPYVDNAWGDAYTIVRVVNSNSQFFGAFASIA